MNTDIAYVITRIGEDFRDEIQPTSRYYREVSIGESAARLGLPGLDERCRDAFAIVPVRQPTEGMKVMIDGRTFVNYAQYESGVVVPGYVAERAGLPSRPYVADESMILDFA
jgi:hypothetical protein